MRIPRTILGLLLILAGLALGGLAWQQSLPDQGDSATIERSLSAAPLAPSTSATVMPAPPPAPTTTLSNPGPEPEPLWSANAQVSAIRQVPVALRIGSLGVQAPIIATGVDDRSGQMEVPDNVEEVAWYRHGPSPGQPGSTVLAAHVDLAGQGPGVFFRLDDLDPGDVVEVEMEDGSVVAFSVAARTVYPKDELPLEAIFSRQGPATLTLVTCGGGFDRSSRSYDSNVVVYATPISNPVSPDRT